MAPVSHMPGEHDEPGDASRTCRGSPAPGQGRVAERLFRYLEAQRTKPVGTGSACRCLVPTAGCARLARQLCDERTRQTGVWRGAWSWRCR